MDTSILGMGQRINMTCLDAYDEQAALEAYEKWLAERRALVLATPVADIAAENADAGTRLLDTAR